MVYLIPTSYGNTNHIRVQLIKLAAIFAAFIWSRFSPTNRLTTVFLDGLSQPAPGCLLVPPDVESLDTKTYAQRFPQCNINMIRHHSLYHQ